MIETHPQFGTGMVEPEKEKNPQPETEGGTQKDDVEMYGDENNDYVNRSAFSRILYARQFKPAGKRVITMVGKHYKLKIEILIRQHMDKSAVSFLWFTSVNW